MGCIWERVEEKHNRMKVACGQEKSKTGSSIRSHANPRERQALSKGSSTCRLQGTRRSGLLTFPCPWARPVRLPDWQPKCEDNRVPCLTYTGVPVAVEMEASSTGTPVAANAVFTSLLAGGPKAFISVWKGTGHSWSSFPRRVLEICGPLYLPLSSLSPTRLLTPLLLTTHIQSINS